MAAADTLAFIESLYGKKFRAVEGGAFSLDKVYRTNGGGLFISETRLNVSVHPKFELRVLNFAGAPAVSQIFTAPPTVFTLLSHTGARERERQRDAWHAAQEAVAAPPLTMHTWNVSQTEGEKVLPAFGYVNVRGQRAQKGLETARGDVTTSTEAQRPTVAPEPASLRLTSIDLRRLFVNTTQQEFVNLLLNTYLPAVESRENLSAPTTGNLSGAPRRRATTQTQRETEKRFAPAPGTTERQPSALTYAEPAPRHAPRRAAEIRTEFRSMETLKESASVRDTRAPLLQVLPPASLLLNLSETSLTMLAGGAGRAAGELGGRAPALLLQQQRAQTTPSGTREASATVHATRLLKQTPRRGATDALEAFSSLNTLVERVHSTFHSITPAAHTTVFTRPGFEPTLRRTFEQVSARQGGGAGETTPGGAISLDLLSQSVEFVRPASAAVFTREASTQDADTQLRSERAPGVFSTQGSTGAGTFRFATELLRRTSGVRTVGVLSPTVATLLRTSADGETARAARPEGMALELIRHRREEVLQLPQPGYVFTQPARAQLEERQVITKTSREEIVEVVRKEVRSLGAASAAPVAASRADIASLAEEVYATLARRLLVERERLGRF